jgi:uncharacterized protein
MHTMIAAALAGVMATPHCAGMCGGFASACARPRPGLWGWHAGRLTTYAALGALAGALGSVLPGPGWVPGAVAAALLVWFAAALAGVAPQPAARIPGLVRAGRSLMGRSGLPARFLFGAVTGLLPCGMVYAALGLAVLAASPLTSALTMLAFGGATVPGLTVLSLGVQRMASRGLWARRALAVLILAVGLWSVAMRSVGAHAHDASAPTVHGSVPASIPAGPRHQHPAPNQL